MLFHHPGELAARQVNSSGKREKAKGKTNNWACLDVRGRPGCLRPVQANPRTGARMPSSAWFMGKGHADEGIRAPNKKAEE